MDLHKFLSTVSLSLLLLLYIYGQVKSEDTGPEFMSGSVYCKDRKCTFRPAVLDESGATAVGTFNDTLLVTGWGILDVKAGYGKNKATNTDLMYAAGYIEGRFTARQMEANFANLGTALLPKDKAVVKKLDQWYIKQRQWADYMVAKHKNTDPLWRHMGYVLAQLDGLLAGYLSNCANKTEGVLNRFSFDFMNGVGDYLDLKQAIDRKSIPDWTKFSHEEARRYFFSKTHCSALIKVLPGLENMFMSHSSWFIYSATNRIFKNYDFNIDDPYTAAKKLSFSSYPGFLESLDDFYLLSSGLVMLQTTINTFNTSLYNLLHPQSLFAWQRVRVANMLAHGGEEWANIIRKYNSGTYNNEYMVIDLNKFTPQKPLVNNTLWVVNQMPGLVKAADATHLLRSGYFPSYNVPYFDEVFVKIGYADYVKKFGYGYSYDLAPRAKIYRRDQSKVEDLMSMKAIMRYNDYKNDKYSGGKPDGAICARGDLGGGADGCYDTKVSDFFMAKAMQADIISGPTLGNNFPPFSWKGKFAKTPHTGLPETYNFDFIRTKPRFD